MYADQQVSCREAVPVSLKMFGILFLLFLSVNGNPAHPGVGNLEFSCSDLRRTCILRDVYLLTEADRNAVSFPRITDPLTIASGRIPHFDRQLAEKLIDIVDLTINGLAIEKLFIRPDITHLEATKNRIHELLVDDRPNVVYQMRTLDLTDNQLSNVSVLSRFTQLRRLKLGANKLTRLSMNVFSGMTELRELSLANNQLFSVDGFRLQKLRSLSLAGNQLLELDVSKWELAALEELDLTHNKLYVLHGQLQRFQVLKRVRLAGNYWKCEVLMGLELELQFDSDEDGRCEQKGMTEERSICCTAAKKEDETNEVFMQYNEKWEDLRKLGEDVKKLDEWVTRHQKQADEASMTKESERSLETRMADFESQLKEVQITLNSREAVAFEEINRIVGNYPVSLDKMDSKQSELVSKLDGSVKELDELKLKVDENHESASSVSENVQQLEKQIQESGIDAALQSATQLKRTVDRLEDQQTKYYHSSMGLKNQISKEGLRANELTKAMEKLYNELAVLKSKIIKVYRLSEDGE